MAIYKLDNVIQNYAWGSKSSIGDLFGFTNPNNEPQAEIWMGAHTGGSSKLVSNGQLLSEFIAKDKRRVLGNYTEDRFGELPFLFKVLAAETPLSIQVHPNKRKAEMGFVRENEQGIPLTAANRNYKDPNHKPELVYALTAYKAMNGFRPIPDIVALFKEVKITTLHDDLSLLEAQQDPKGLKQFFSSIMTLEGDRKAFALKELSDAYKLSSTTVMAQEALQFSEDFSQHYENDIGLFSPLLLNTVELAPGEAMFLHAETPHAYVKGTGLEIMASSDNVLRAGLTPKHIDVPELIDNTVFESINPEEIRLKPVLKNEVLSYPIPVDDFGFDVLTARLKAQTQYLRSAEILFCVKGKATISAGNESITVNRGESVFISNELMAYTYHGDAILARAFN